MSVELAEPVAMPEGAVAHGSARPVDLPRWLRVVDNVGVVVLNLALVAQVSVVFLNTLLRWFYNSTIIFGVDEMSQLFLIVVAFLGGAVAYGRGHFMFISILVDRLPPRGRVFCAALVEWVVIAVTLMIGGWSIPLQIENAGEKTALLEIGYVWLTVPMTFGTALLALHAGCKLWRKPPGMVLGAFLLTAAVCAALWFSQGMDWTDTSWLYVLITAVFVGLIGVGVPVGFVLASVGITYVVATGSVPLEAMAMTAQRGTGGFIFLALPFFILAGFVMDRGGIGTRIIAFLSALIGHLRGGLLQVSIVGMYIVSGISGSKAADMAAIGIPLNDVLRKRGYDPDEAAAVLAASAAMGESIPPSIGILALGSVTSISTGALFLGGLLPAAVIAACLMGVVYVRSRLAGLQRAPRASLGERLRTGRGAIIPLFMPVFLVAGIVSGFGTPTEISSFAAVYGFILGGVLYREIGARAAWDTLTDTSMLCGMIFFTFSGATLFSWTLSLAGVPGAVGALLQDLGANAFLPAVIVITVLLGAVLESIVTIIILGPLLLPVALHLGVHPVQFGIVLIEAFGIGSILPPVGLGLYIACAICKTSVENTSRRLVFYFLALCIGLLFVAAVPTITLALPDALMSH